MGKEIGHKCVTEQCEARRFSIFFCGCKQPKSIHMSNLCAKVQLSERREKKNAKFFASMVDDRFNWQLFASIHSAFRSLHFGRDDKNKQPRYQEQNKRRTKQCASRL